MYTELILDDWISLERWWNGTDGVKQNYLGGKKLLQCHFVHHKCQIYLPDNEPSVRLLDGLLLILQILRKYRINDFMDFSIYSFTL